MICITFALTSTFNHLIAIITRTLETITLVAASRMSRTTVLIKTLINIATRVPVTRETFHAQTLKPALQVKTIGVWATTGIAILTLIGIPNQFAFRGTHRVSINTVTFITDRKIDAKRIFST